MLGTNQLPPPRSPCDLRIDRLVTGKGFSPFPSAPRRHRFEMVSRSCLRTLVSGTSTSAFGAFADVHTSTEQARLAQSSETGCLTHPVFQQSFRNRQPPHLRRWPRAARKAGLEKRNQRRHGHSETRRFMTYLRPRSRCDAYLPIHRRGGHP